MKKFYEEPIMECVVIADEMMVGGGGNQIGGASDGSDEEF